MSLHEQLTKEIRIINFTLRDFGVDAGTRPTWTTIAGASYITYELRTGRTQRNADIARLLPELSERLSAHRRRPTPVRMLEMPLRLEVQHPAPQPLDWRKAILRIGASRLLSGRNYSATPTGDCIVDLAGKPHVLIAGITGSGKSTMLRMMLASMAYSTPPDALRIYLVDRKNEDLVPFAALPHVEGAAWTLDESIQIINTFSAEPDSRVEQGTADWVRLLLVVDELAQLAPESLKTLSSILAIGRSKRMHVLAATQHPTVSLIGDKSNYPVRFVGQVVDAQTAAIATGRKQSGAELLPGSGAFLYVDGARLERIQAYHLDAAAVPALVTTIGAKWGPAPTRTATRPAVVPDDEITQIARTIEPLWRAGASKNAMAKAALDRPYAGSYTAKIDRAIALLEASTLRSTTTTHTSESASNASSSSRTPAQQAPILRIGGAR